MGFKHTVTPDSFLNCAQEICGHSQSRRPRINENVLIYRATFVVNFLYNNFDNLQFNETEWNYLISIPFVPTSNIMDNLYSEITPQKYRKFECLKSLCLPKYKDIAWTQVAFFSELAIPSEDSHITKKGNFGKPNAGQILDHLCMVAEKIPESRSWRQRAEHFQYILDEIYDALNSACEGEDPELKEQDFEPGERIFLNIDPNEDPFDRRNWFAANELIVNVSKGENGFVKASLSNYESLLKAAGSGEVIAPRVTPSSEDDIDDTFDIPQSKFVLDRLNEFLSDGSRFPLNDVTFIVRDEEIQANRCVLAAASDHFFNMFCKNFRESNPIMPAEIDGCDIDPKSFRILLRWLYGEPLEKILGISNSEKDPDDQSDSSGGDENGDANHEYDEDHFDLLKDLLKASDYYDINKLKAKIGAELRRYIRLKNVRDVFELADECQAAGLKDFCEEFMSLNSNLL